MLKMKIVFGLLFSFFLFSCEEKISKNDLEEYKSMMDIRLGHLGNAIIMQGRLLDSFNLSNERADEDHFKEAEELVKSNLESFGRSDELRNLKIPNSRKLREIHNSLIEASELLNISRKCTRRQCMVGWISFFCGKKFGYCKSGFSKSS